MTVPISPPPVVIPGALWWMNRVLTCSVCGKTFQLPDFVEPWIIHIESVPSPITTPPLAQLRCPQCHAISQYVGENPTPLKGRDACLSTPSTVLAAQSVP